MLLSPHKNYTQDASNRSSDKHLKVVKAQQKGNQPTEYAKWLIQSSTPTNTNFLYKSTLFKKKKKKKDICLAERLIKYQLLKIYIQPVQII